MDQSPHKDLCPHFALVLHKIKLITTRVVILLMKFTQKIDFHTRDVAAHRLEPKVKKRCLKELMNIQY